MIKYISRARQRQEAGFTLIELLVVIIILGILAAVVVFAVRGAGDKGKAAAISSDAKTIRTAEEAFCGKEGRYGSTQELVDGRFLSDKPEYHGVQAVNNGGPCNGWSFVMAGTETALGGPGPGSFQAVGISPLRSTYGLVQLSSGKVLAIGDDVDGNPAAALYDPTDGNWDLADAPPNYVNTYGAPALLLTDTAGTPAVECGAHCGKVLVHLVFEWRLFNSNAPAGSQWEPVPGSSASYSGQHYGASGNILLTDNPATPALECGPNCGKVLITAFEPNTTPVWELYDPAADTFAQFNYANPTQASQVSGTGHFTSLPGGKILMVGGQSAKLFDSSQTFSNASPYVFPDAARPPLRWDAFPGWPTTVALPDGRVLISGSTDPRDSEVKDVRASGVYTPDPGGGQGSWQTIGSCAPASVPDPHNCYLLASVPGGKVLAYTVNEYLREPYYSPGATYVFDAGTTSWTRGPNLPTPPYAANAAVLLDPAVGPCAAQCGKVLMAGYNTDFGDPPTSVPAVLYTP